jgi:hypothetical protein
MSPNNFMTFPIPLTLHSGSAQPPSARRSDSASRSASDSTTNRGESEAYK